MHRPLALAALLAATAIPAGAQQPEPPAPAPVVAPAVTPAPDSAIAEAPMPDELPTIAPGMSREEVVARFGRPAAERASGSYTYLFFRNDCVRSCGMDDLVVLRDGRVTDAVLRGGDRRYAGASSSPAGSRAEPTLGGRGARSAPPAIAMDAPAPAMVERPAGVQLNAPADTTRPAAPPDTPTQP